VYDWIIEADIYRLKKAYVQADTKEDRDELARKIAAKRELIGGVTVGNAVASWPLRAPSDRARAGSRPTG